MIDPDSVIRPVRPLRVLQFGGGNFLRAFVDWSIDVLNEETDFNAGVAVVKPTPRGDYEELRAQDGLFTVVLEGIRRGEAISDRRVVKCVQQVIHPYNERAAFLATAVEPEMRFIVSNTTEAGIRFREEELPKAGMPVEFPGKLCLWLNHRFEHFGRDNGRGRGCVVLPLELVEDNGDQLRACILRYAEHWDLPEAFRTWITEENVFCNTLVDRIVSGYPTDRAAELSAELGYDDPLLVAGEYYHSWIIAGPESVAEELPFAQTGLNVTFTDDLAAYRDIKVRILNGAHTAIVPVGYLAGRETVGDVMADPALSDFLHGVLYDEIIPSLDYPAEELKTFAADVLDRFRNPAIHHRLLDISLNSTTKFRTRLLPSLLAYQDKKDALPIGIVRALAALLRFYRGDRNGEPIPLRDAADRIGLLRDEWAAVTGGTNDLLQFTANVLGRADWWGQDLTAVPGLTEAVVAELKKLP